MPKKDYIKLFTEFNAELQCSTPQAGGAHDLSVKCAPNLSLSLEPTKRHRLVGIDDLTFYRSKMDYFLRNDVYSYALTISPRSSPLINNKSLIIQSQILYITIKNVLSSYDCNYWLTFETYADYNDLHLHGFITFPSLQVLKEFRKGLREAFKMPKLKPKTKDSLTDVKPNGYDKESKERWSGYCVKEMRYSMENGFYPFYRINDAFKVSNRIAKPKAIREPIIIEDVPQFNLNDVKIDISSLDVL